METLKEYVTAAIDGKEVESVNMGGMGEGYENAIQHLAYCIMVELADAPVPQSKEDRIGLVRQASDKWVKKLHHHGFSGAQVGAAGNLASIFWVKGPEVALNEMRELDNSRIIKVLKGTVQNYSDSN